MRSVRRSVKEWMKAPLSDSMRRRIFAAYREKGVDQDNRHAVQEAATGKRSLKEFTNGDAYRLLDHLGGKKSKPRIGTDSHGLKQYDNVIEIATIEQKEKIRCYAENDLGWQRGWFANGRENESISKIIRKHSKGRKHLISQLTKAEAWSVIEALKKIRERKDSNHGAHGGHGE